MKKNPKFRGLLSIAMGGSGDQLIMNLNDGFWCRLSGRGSYGQILCWDHEVNSFLPVANSFTHLVEKIAGHIFDPESDLDPSELDPGGTAPKKD
ncbi:MAG TPA: SMI1/KNR4 family protein [Anaerolineaceae bacterium]